MNARLPNLHVAIAVIERSGRILICRRQPRDVLGGYWEFPGGKRRPGEPWLACLRRELREELGVPVTGIRDGGMLRYRYPHGQVTLRILRCTIGRKHPKPLASHQLRWVLPSQLRRYRFPPANGPLLARLSKA